MKYLLVSAFFYLMTTLTALADFKFLKEVRGWSIVLNDAIDEQSCRASASYRNGVTLIFGLFNEQKEWRLLVSNDDWKSIVEGEQYEIEYIFDRKTRWLGDDVGVENGLLSTGLKEKFIDNLASANLLQITFKGKEIARLSLVGTKASIIAVLECYETFIAKKDPFATDDPFASTVKNPKPSENNEHTAKLRFSGQSVISNDNRLLFTIGEQLSAEQIAQRVLDYGYKVVINNESVGELAHVYVNDGQEGLLGIFYKFGTNQISRIATYSKYVQGLQNKSADSELKNGSTLNERIAELKCSTGYITMCKMPSSEYQNINVLLETDKCKNGEKAFIEKYDFEQTRKLSKIKTCIVIDGFILEGAKEKLQDDLLPYGNRIGQEVTITSRDALGSKKASFGIDYTRRNAGKFCREYILDNSESCILEELNHKFKSSVEANCVTGLFTSFYGEKFAFKGRREVAVLDNEGRGAFYNIEYTDNDGSKKNLDGSVPSRYHIQLNLISKLCPNFLIDILAY